MQPILEGRKTQTRRLWKRRRVREGSVHQARTALFGAPFARLRALRVWQERLGEISEQDAYAEGYESRDAFLSAFERINGQAPLDEPVWCVEFRVEG
ncbi:MAG: ASCH domain-containing protein [Chloroflexota bacterium]